MGELLMADIAKTQITFTVLHRADDPVLSGKEFIGEYDRPTDGLLGYVMQEAWDGGMVGIESDPVTTPVAPGDVKAELLAMGNDGEFFSEEDEDD